MHLSGAQTQLKCAQSQSESLEAPQDFIHALSAARDSPHLSSFARLLDHHPVLCRIAETAYNDLTLYRSDMSAGDRPFIWVAAVITHFKHTIPHASWLTEPVPKKLALSETTFTVIREAYALHATALFAACKRDTETADAFQQLEQEREQALAEREQALAQRAQALAERNDFRLASEFRGLKTTIARSLRSFRFSGLGMTLQRILSITVHHPNLTEEKWDECGKAPGQSELFCSFEDARSIHDRYRWIYILCQCSPTQLASVPLVLRDYDAFEELALPEQSDTTTGKQPPTEHETDTCSDTGWVHLPQLHEFLPKGLPASPLYNASSSVVRVNSPLQPNKTIEVMDVRCFASRPLLEALGTFFNSWENDCIHTLNIAGPPGCGKSVFSWLLATTLSVGSTADVLYIPFAWDIVAKPLRVFHAVFAQSAGPLAQAAMQMTSAQEIEHALQVADLEAPEWAMLQEVARCSQLLAPSSAADSHGMATMALEHMLRYLRDRSTHNRNSRLLIVDDPRKLMRSHLDLMGMPSGADLSTSASGPAHQCVGQPGSALFAPPHVPWQASGQLVVWADYAGVRIKQELGLANQGFCVHFLPASCDGELDRMLVGQRGMQAADRDTPRALLHAARTLWSAVDRYIGAVPWSQLYFSPKILLETSFVASCRDEYLASLKQVLLRERMRAMTIDREQVLQKTACTANDCTPLSANLHWYFSCLGVDAGCLMCSIPSEAELPKGVQSAIIEHLKVHAEQTDGAHIMDPLYNHEQQIIKPIELGLSCPKLHKLQLVRVPEADGLKSILKGSQVKELIEADIDGVGCDGAVEQMRISAHDEMVRLAGTKSTARMWTGECFRQQPDPWQICVDELRRLFLSVRSNTANYPGGVILTTPDSFPCFDAIKVFCESVGGWSVLFIEITQSGFKVHSNTRAYGGDLAGVFGVFAMLARLDAYRHPHSKWTLRFGRVLLVISIASRRSQPVDNSLHRGLMRSQLQVPNSHIAGAGT